MNKKLKNIIFILMITGLISGCTYNNTSDKTEPNEVKILSNNADIDVNLNADKEYNFFFICPIMGSPYWNNLISGIETADIYYGVHTETIGPEELSEEKRFAYFKQAVACRPDGIFMSAFANPEYADYVNKVIKSGVPVAFIESDASAIEDKANMQEATYWVGTDNYAAGYLAGETMAKAVNKKAKIGILTGSLELDNITRRVDGFCDAVSKYPEMGIITIESSDSSTEKGMKIVEEMLENYEIDAILGTSATDIVAAANIVQDQKRSDICLVGFDDLEATKNYIKNGVVYATIAQSAYDMGWLSVQLLIQDIQNVGHEKNKFEVSVTLVTADNIDTYKNY